MMGQRGKWVIECMTSPDSEFTTLQQSVEAGADRVGFHTHNALDAIDTVNILEVNALLLHLAYRSMKSRLAANPGLCGSALGNETQVTTVT